MFIIGKDLWEIDTGAETLPGTASQEEQERFKKRENLALASVCLSVCTSLQIYIKTAGSVKKHGKTFRNILEKSHFAGKIFYQRKLYSAKIAKGTDIIDHINYLKTLAEHLEAVDDAVLEKDLVIILISSLPEEYNYLITALETVAEEILTCNYIWDRLIHEFDKMKNDNACRKAEGDSNHDALISKQTSTPTTSLLIRRKLSAFNARRKDILEKIGLRRKRTVINKRKLKKSPHMYL